VKTMPLRRLRTLPLFRERGCLCFVSHEDTASQVSFEDTGVLFQDTGVLFQDTA